MLDKWKCRQCGKVLMEFGADTKGSQVKTCDRCHCVNVMVDGVPQGMISVRRESTTPRGERFHSG